VSPAQVEHLLRGYFNTWALYGLSTIDAAFFDDKPDMRTDQLPVVRRFFRDEPAQNTKYLSQLYEAIDAATETRRTMRFMDRTWRPEIAGELENKVENRLYSQLNTADQQLRVFRKEIEQIYRMPSLPELQKFADERARATRNPSLTGRARFDGVWDDLGALKRFLIDDIIRERNAYAETVMADVEARRGELQGAGPE
jgi:hypothetical protein